MFSFFSRKNNHFGKKLLMQTQSLFKIFPVFFFFNFRTRFCVFERTAGSCIRAFIYRILVLQINIISAFQF